MYVSQLQSYILLCLGHHLIFILFPEEVRTCLTKYWIEYTYNIGCTLSLTLLVTSY